MNRLAAETSPYLRQHATNPVDWYPWGDEAFAVAKQLDRPVMLSVGYSSCHWCHVMAHESFEDPDTAGDLNGRFVSVKVDREERPDVDAVYMEAVQAVSGRGGWPMTVFLTPEGKPFFAGTYFPARDMPGVPSFRRVLDAVDDAWRNRRHEVEEQADALLDAVSKRSRVSPGLMSTASRPSTGEPSGEDLAQRAPQLLEDAARHLEARFDGRWGGFSAAPKFPHPALVEMCLVHDRLSGNGPALEMARTTLDAMAAGGIYDHLGGGFHRYSTDDAWTVPHFEKMLYDQAGLVRAYLHAWQVTHEARWLAIVEETVGYVLRDLRLVEGGLCSAEDADSEGEEGRFYLWTQAEISAVLGQQLGSAASQWYGVTSSGNFEGSNILRRPLGADALRPPDIERAREALLAQRAKRVRPERDDKVLTEWNAMFGSALAEAAGATGREEWAAAAVNLADFLFAELRRQADGRWLRSWQDGHARHLAYAGDYAWVVDLFTRLSELTGRALWLERAREAASAMLDLFFEPGLPLYTTGSDAERLVVRPMELADGATPSATAVAGSALVRLGSLIGDANLLETGTSLLETLLAFAPGQPLAVASAVVTWAVAAEGTTEVVIGDDREDLLSVARARYEPGQVLAWGERYDSPLWEGRTDSVAYVCRRYSCQAPASTVDELEARLDAERDFDRSRFSLSVAAEPGGSS